MLVLIGSSYAVTLGLGVIAVVLLVQAGNVLIDIGSRNW